MRPGLVIIHTLLLYDLILCIAYSLWGEHEQGSNVKQVKPLVTSDRVFFESSPLRVVRRHI